MYSTSPLKGVCNVVKYWDADQSLMSLSKVSPAAGYFYIVHAYYVLFSFVWESIHLHVYPINSEKY